MPATPESAAGSQLLDLLMPLAYFYGRHGREMPPVGFIAGDEVPEPWHHLLVHASDMTPRLRAFHQSPILLDVKEADVTDDFVMRKVILRRQDTMRAVEYGAIGIHLSGFSTGVKQRIREGREPLGGVLEAENIPHRSAPRGFFRVTADDVIAGLLCTEPGAVHYGRSNVLEFPDGTVFADIVEIIPPEPAES